MTEEQFDGRQYSEESERDHCDDRAELKQSYDAVIIISHLPNGSGALCFYNVRVEVAENDESNFLLIDRLLH